MKYLFLFILVILVGNKSLAQNDGTIILQNASFEDIPTCCKPPNGWTDCGFKGETPPDIQPALDQNNKPFFGVTQKAFDGETYMGMVVRENETYERVSQQLIKPLEKGSCYTFSIMLCRSDTYLSASNRNEPNNLKQFTEPIHLKIWGGDAHCNQKELLAVSPLIENTDWEEYEFEFQAQSELNYIILEAFYKTPLLFPYNGNVLLDKASDIIELDCILLNKN